MVAEEGQQQGDQEQGYGHDSPGDADSGSEVGLGRAALDDLFEREVLSSFLWLLRWHSGAGFGARFRCRLRLGAGGARSDAKVGARIRARVFRDVPGKGGRGHVIYAGAGADRMLGRFRVLGAKFGHDIQRPGLAFAESVEIFGDRFFGVEADVAGIGADETFVENAAGKLVEALILERL